MNWLTLLLPEILLALTACVLFMLGFIRKNPDGRIPAVIATAMLLTAFCVSWAQFTGHQNESTIYHDAYNSIRVGQFGLFARAAALGIGLLIVLLSWPSLKNGRGNVSVHFGTDSAEYFALILLSLCGLCLTATANDLTLLFMAVELASIPTYILVATSRPVLRAQEAGLKYFFLGAMSAGILLMGLAYLYGLSGTTKLADIAAMVKAGELAFSSFTLLAVLLILIGLSFKLAAFPMHAYAADVYQGAATPVTTLLGFVPKAVGIIALIKILFATGGAKLTQEPIIVHTIVAMAIATMTLGNVLALIQQNVKRMLAYSSVAHSGYLLAALAVAASAQLSSEAAGQALLFYLAIYGLMNVVAFGTLSLIPSRSPMLQGEKFLLPPGNGAETLDDLSGVGRSKPLLGLAMTIAMLGLIGIPLTGGFTGKLLILRSAFDTSSLLLQTLGIILLINSAIGAAYYLKVIGAMFLREKADSYFEPEVAEKVEASNARLSLPFPAVVSVTIACVFVVAVGVLGPAIDALSTYASAITQIDDVRAP